MKVNIRSLIEELDWVCAATDKEVEDEILALNDDLDEISGQIRDRGCSDYKWHFSAVLASKYKRKKLQLLRKMRPATEGKLIFEGELKHEMDILKAKERTHEVRIEKMQNKLNRGRKDMEGLVLWLKENLDKKTLKSMFKQAGRNIRVTFKQD